MSVPILDQSPTPTAKPEGARQQARDRAQERILEAASREFAARGFSGTSVASIAERAGVTKGLVHHYFGAKRALWERVKERHGEVAAAAAGPSPDSASSLDALCEWIERAFYFFQREPDLLRMAAWAEIEESYKLPDSLLALEGEIADIFQRAQQEGAIRDDIDVFSARAMVQQLLAGWFQNKRFLSQAWSEDPAFDGSDETYLRDMLAVVRAGLAPNPTTDA